ncbi:iron chelate uptake ABC transporter family permease subunit (plasmid) [Pseudoalteromonas espejiana]
MLAVLVGLVLAKQGRQRKRFAATVADPSIIGISAGAAMVAVAFIALSAQFNFNAQLYLPYASFLGALGSYLAGIFYCQAAGANKYHHTYSGGCH